MLKNIKNAPGGNAVAPPKTSEKIYEPLPNGKVDISEEMFNRDII